MTLRWPLSKKIVPSGDLGIPDGVDFGLEFPKDTPIVLALQVNRTAQGMRIVSSPPNGNASTLDPLKSVIRPDTTEGAGSTPLLPLMGYRGLALYIEVLALSGAPTNVIYRPAFTPDGGTTWYQSAQALTTTTGLVIVSFAQGIGAATVANDVKASASFAGPPYDAYRLDWLFTGGTAPQVRHKITGFYN